MRLGFAIDTLVKAAPGGERGPKATHKYLMRRLTFQGGERRWIYYYADKKRVEQVRQTAKDPDAHRHIDELAKEVPMIRNARKPLSEISEEYLQGLFRWSKAPKISITPGVVNKFHKPISDAHKKGGDTEELLGQPMSPYRALEAAIELIPPNVRAIFGNELKEINVGEAMKIGHASGVFYPATSKINIEAGKSLGPLTKSPHMKGGLWPVEVAVHEMGHAIAGSIGDFGHDVAHGWKGKTFKDFESWYQRTGKREEAITEYGKKNIHELFAESFTAALMFPRDLAMTSEPTYEWFREFLGHDAMRPLRTDKEGIRKLQEELKSIGGDQQKAALIQRKIDGLQGVLDMSRTDHRLQWWTGKKSKVQQLLSAAPAGDYGAVNEDPKDKFYEMSHGGRTVYFRYGPSGKGKDFVGWEPAKAGASDGKGGTKRLIAAVSEIKEIYDGDGKPLSNDTAWWYLHQDDPEFRDGGKDADALLTFMTDAGGSLLGSKDQKEVIDRNKFNKLMSYDSDAVVQARKRGKVHEKEGSLPEAITRDEFRLRSGTFTFDNWKIAGNDALERMKHSTYGSKEWEAAFAEVRGEQPWIEFTQAGSGAREYRKGNELVQDSKTGGWVPKFHSVRFVNENADGSKTYIAAKRDESGKYYLSDPVWRKLLTPFGEDINGSADLIAKCKAAAEAQFGGPPDFLAQPRRTWISVLTDPKRAGDTDHYYHLQVEFDGRGSPKIIGEKWKALTGKSEPRMEDLLTPSTGTETGRAKIVSEPIKVNKPKRRNKRLPPYVGERIVLSIRADEVQAGEHTDKDIVAKLVRVVPGKKAGEVPSPPGWDRMPEGVMDTLPVPGDREKSGTLTKREKELVKQTLLPDFYKGTESQRQWLEKVYEPAYAEWEATKDELTSKSLPEIYVLTGEAKGGAPGQTFRRYGLDDVASTVRLAVVERVPNPLPHDVLCYVHQELDAKDGRPVHPPELRLLPPSDGSLTMEAIEGLPGVTVHRAPVGADAGDGAVGAVDWISAGIAGFARLREALDGLSMTAEAEQYTRSAVNDLKSMVDDIKNGKHAFALEEIDPPLLRAMGVDIAEKAPNGNAYELPLHTRRGVQKMIDGGMRGFAAHFMGTGKTHLGLITAKLAVAIHRNPKLAADHGLDPADFPNKVLVIAPLNTLEQWRAAVDDFDGGAQVIGNSQDAMSAKTYLASGDTSDIVIVGPEYYTLHAKELRSQFDMIIADEAHKGLKNESAERNIALKAANEDLKGLVLMTGTPETMGPWDWVQYVQLITKGKIWGDMTEAQFIKEFCDESAVPGELGSDRKGPRVVIKPSRRREFAAIISSIADVALTKDVIGKTMPVIRMGETEHAHMVGVQAMLYAAKMASLPHGALETLASNAALARDEMAGLGDEQRKQVAAAKSISNCPAITTESESKFVTFTKITSHKEGADTTSQEDFRTFDPDQLMKRDKGVLAVTNKTYRDRFKGKWPRIAEIGEEQALLYDMHLHDVLGASYAELEGTKITPAQLAALKADGWPRTVDNPEWGPLGIRFRGVFSEPTGALKARIETAKDLQRSFAAELHRSGDPDAALVAAAQTVGVSIDDARALRAMRHDTGEFQSSISSHGTTVTTKDRWVSDKRESKHWLYHPDDCDDHGKPLAGGGFDKVSDGDMVDAAISSLKYGPKATDLPPGVRWEPPTFTYDADQGTNAKGEVALVAEGAGEPPGRIAEGDVVWVKKDLVRAVAKSLNHPGTRTDKTTGKKVRLRDERAKADLAMTVGNAKSEQLKAHLERFFLSTGKGGFDEGAEGSRQTIVFAGDILGGVRMTEATLRTMGFRDVNEMIEGSKWFDPADADGAPNGKYYITYLGKGGTIGNRELNVEIAKKVKDKLNRDTDTSQFVYNTMEGRAFKAYGADSDHPTILRSRWTQDQRTQIYKTFKINAPEAIYNDPKGRKLYFYGSRASAKILEQMKDLPDPAHVSDSKQAADVKAKLDELKGLYEATVIAGLKTKGPDGQLLTRGDAPITPKQIAVFNNCVIPVLSDAAQVGLNFGNAVEQIWVDNLPSPQSEAQRMTRSARLLDMPIKQVLLDPQIQSVKGIKGTKFAYVHTIDEKNEISTREKGSEVQIKYRDAKGEEQRAWVSQSSVASAPSPVEKLKAQEAKLFQPGPRGLPSGNVKGFTIAGGTEGPADITIQAALSALAAHAQEQAAVVENKAQAAQWDKIAAQARFGASLGILQAVDALHNLQDTKTPGGRDNVIAFSDVKWHDPMEGTYDGRDGGADVGIPPEAAIRKAMDSVLSEKERELFAQAGFVKSGASTYDPVAVYMAIRSQEILDTVAKERPVVESRLRASAAGAVVTEADVFNTIIDSLNPADRAILKTKKYLVNITRLSVSADMPQFTSVPAIAEDGTKTTQEVFTGYEREQPVAIEKNVRAMARARQRPYEERMQDIQSGMAPEIPLDFETTDSKMVADLSRLDTPVAKAERPSVRLGISVARLVGVKS